MKLKGNQQFEKIEEVLQLGDFTYRLNDNNIYSIPYQNEENLNKLIQQLDPILLTNEYTYATYSVEESERFANFVRYEQLRERIMNWPLVRVINEGLFTQHMQPIVQLTSEEVFGYEFLVRPIPSELSFNPGTLFSFSQKAGLQSVLDSQARISSIEISSKFLRNGVKRFINFLPSSIYDPNHCLKSTLYAVEKYGVQPEDLIFEVVETEKIHDIDHLKNIFNVYQKQGIQVALDDLGAGFATVDILRELKPNFAKIDRAIIDHCDQYTEKQTKIKEIVNVADAYGIKLLAEGIERKEEADLCAELNIPLAQGYYFGRPKAEPDTNVFTFANLKEERP
ncbi:EAL domain-containing protein [Alkalihalophilus sp. As8PL]|uniref:EAL domain-containing protein n=1 Tax=Alkalihalophilus sp. As8PL TaxID=3237103 RepID=A0AB39BS55_9BACI